MKLRRQKNYPEPPSELIDPVVMFWLYVIDAVLVAAFVIAVFVKLVL